MNVWRARHFLTTSVILWARREWPLWWAWLRVVLIATGAVTFFGAAWARLWQWVFW